MRVRHLAGASSGICRKQLLGQTWKLRSLLTPPLSNPKRRQATHILPNHPHHPRDQPHTPQATPPAPPLLQVPFWAKALVGEVDVIGKEEPMSEEKLCPVLAM